MSGKLMQAVLAVVVFYTLAAPIACIKAAESGDERGAERSEYELGPQDKVSIKVYEWRPSRDEIYEWTAFKAEYMVSAAGSLSLPLLGDIPASGLSTMELSRELGLRLKNRMGLAESPDVTVEVVQFRPFYVVGAVDKPGEYSYRPGLTVLQAYAIAGGKPHTVGPARLEREAIGTRGELTALELETQNLRARLARLQAELSNTSTVAWPPELEASTVKQEQLVFDMRRESFQNQINALEQLGTFLEKGAASLEKQLDVHKIEAEAVRSEYELVENLYKKGLSPVPRKLALQRNVAQVDGERLRLEDSLMRARQEISRTEIAIVDLRGTRNSEVSSELQKAQARLEELKSRTDTSKSLLYETEVLAPLAISAQDDAQQFQPVFKILSQAHASTGRVVSPDSLLKPGDTLTVEQPWRGAGEASVRPPNVSRTSVELSSEQLR